MSPIHPLAAAHERQRWLRHDAHRFLRPDWRHFVQPGSELAVLYEEIERKYRPDQPRVLAGNAGGGRGRAMEERRIQVRKGQAELEWPAR